MDGWSSPDERAAVWYVGAFAAIASVLVAGAQFSRFHWAEAPQPALAIAVALVAVGSAFAVLWMASMVLVPRYSLGDLQDLQAAADARAMEKTGSSDWQHSAAQNATVLEPLYALDGFDADTDSPIQLGRRARSDPHAAKRAGDLVAAANRRHSTTWFARVRIGAPIAGGVILVAVLSWPALTAEPTQRPSAAHPVAVRLTLNPSADPARLFGPDCHERQLAGVAVDGDIEATAVVAFPDQGSCTRALVQVDARMGTLTRQ